MKKSIIVSGLLALALASSLGAKELDLRANMMRLNVELNEIQRGFIKSSQKKILVHLEAFAKNADDLLADRDNMIKMLPKDMKNKKHKVNIAVESARKIKYNVTTIKEAIENKDKLSIIKRQATAQEAYTNIVNACFKCHNLVRDKGRITE